MLTVIWITLNEGEQDLEDNTEETDYRWWTHRPAESNGGAFQRHFLQDFRYAGSYSSHLGITASVLMVSTNGQYLWSVLMAELLCSIVFLPFDRVLYSRLNTSRSSDTVALSNQ